MSERHARKHRRGGEDELRLDELGAPDDTRKLDASIAKHGLLPKLSGRDAEFLRGDGTWAKPTPTVYEAFPVGAVFIAVVGTNPGELLGYGTWVLFAEGRTLVGLDSADTDFDAAEETGGAKTHTLTAAEMPAHTHTQQVTATLGAGTTGSRGVNAADDTGAGQTGSTGSGGAHNNMPPYIVVFIWKRTA